VELWALGVPTIVGLVVLLSREYAKALVKTNFDKALEDYRAGHAELLAQIQHQYDVAMKAMESAATRRTHEVSLYNTRRHDVAARLFALFQKASGLFSNRIGVTVEPDWAQYSLAEVQAYVAKNKVSEALAAPVLRAYEDRQGAEAARLMGALYQKVAVWQAREALRRARNYQVLNLLYLSPAAEAKLDAVYMAIVNVSTRIDHSGPGDVLKLIELKASMLTQVNELQALLRHELRYGLDDEVAVDTAVRPD
jgi:hypothetical protein